MNNKYTVLVIEDEEPLLAAIEAKLKKSGFDVVTARMAKAGLDLLQEGKVIHAIWLDHYLLGKETGLDFLARIKEDQEWKKIPVFVVSNTAGPEKQQVYLKLGVEKYFTKSMVRLESIIEDIRESLGKSS